MNYDAIKVWVDIAQFIITGAIGVYIYLVNKSDATNERISTLAEDHDERLDDHQGRIARIEEAMKHMPTHDDLDELKRNVATLQAETRGQTQLLERLEKTVGRISDWLITQAK